MSAEFNAGKLAIFALIAVGVYLVLLIVGRHFKRVHNVRFGRIYLLFCGVTALFVPAEVLAVRHPLERELLSAVILLGTLVGVAFLRRFLWEKYFRDGGKTDAPRMLREVGSVLIVLVALVVVLKRIYGVEVPGLLAGSGIAAVVLGLAMQDLLSNIIAGLALHFEKPFRVGDWLMHDKQFAQVMEMNWRATRLRTNDAVLLAIPNRELAHQTIVNLHYPEPRHAVRLDLGVEHDAPPSAVKDALLRAAGNAAGVLAEPAPQVSLKDFGNHAIVYEVRFWIEDHAIYNTATDAVRTNAWYELRRAGVRIPVNPGTVQLERNRPPALQTRPETVRAMLDAQPLFQSLNEAERETLLNGSRSLWYGRGEKIIRQDAAGDSMFLLIRGSAGVLVNRGRGPVQVAVVRAGDCFGEMSLLTGEPRTATLIAREDCETLEITKAAMAAVLQHNPVLSSRLSELLAQRQLETDEAYNSTPPDPASGNARQARYAAGFLSKVQTFFQL